MSRKTSIYLNPQLEALHKAKDEPPLAEALYRGLAVNPLLIEKNEQGGFTTHWFCAVPAKGIKFTVHSDHWRTCSSGEPIREIYLIQID